MEKSRSRRWERLGQYSSSDCGQVQLPHFSPLSITAGFIILIFCIGAACQALEPEGIETQTALSVEATLIAMQSAGEVQPTIAAQSATMTAQTGLITQQAAQIGQQAAELTQSVTGSGAADSGQPSTDQPPPTLQPTPPPLPSLTPTRSVDVMAMGKTANILLYEDMAGVYNTSRYIKQALDDMDFKYTDTADHLGDFKQALLKKPVEGKDWDLVISANEGRTRYTMIRGEFFTYFLDLLEQGTAVIMEAWNLDSSMDQPLRDLLDACGLEYHGDMYDLRDQSQVFYSAYPNSSILTYPNQPALYNVANYWELKGDLGDLLQLSDGSHGAV